MAKKNIVFMINVKNALGDGNQKVEYEMSIDSWKRWSDNNNSEVFVMEEPVLDPKEMHIIWQRYFLWDIFDNMNMDVDQVILVDCDTLVHPKHQTYLIKQNTSIVWYMTLVVTIGFLEVWNTTKNLFLMETGLIFGSMVIVDFK